MQNENSQAPGSLPYPILEESTTDGQYWIHNCGTMLDAVQVKHPIHDSPFPGAGSGQVHTEMVPYCPSCGPKPSSAGTPLREDPQDAQEAEILRRMRDQQ